MQVDGVLMKVLVVGGTNVGKTAFITRYAHGRFQQSYKATIGVDFALKVIQANGEQVRIQLWDVAGQELVGSMTRAYFKDAMGAFVVADITQADSFSTAKRWKIDLESKVKFPNSDNAKDIPTFLLVNKSDLRADKHITDAQIAQFAKDNNFDGWYVVSVKESQARKGDLTGKTVESSIDDVVMELAKNVLAIGSAPVSRSSQSVVLTGHSQQRASSGCAC